MKEITHDLTFTPYTIFRGMPSPSFNQPRGGHPFGLIQIHHCIPFFGNLFGIFTIFRVQINSKQLYVYHNVYGWKPLLRSIQQLLEWNICYWTGTPHSTLLHEPENLSKNQGQSIWKKYLRTTKIFFWISQQKKILGCSGRIFHI